MKCPHNNFKNCLIEKCPSCNYETIIKKTYESYYPIRPTWMSDTEWEKSFYTTEKVEYRFVSCHLVNQGIQPSPQINIKNNQTTRVSYQKNSIF